MSEAAATREQHERLRVAALGQHITIGTVSAIRSRQMRFGTVAIFMAAMRR